MKTSDLIGPALDWAVGYARCMEATGGKPIQSRDLMGAALRNGMASSSTDWAEGGPIIERMFAQGLRLHNNEFGTNPLDRNLIVASLNGDVHAGFYFGPTPLIAAMRCYLGWKLGDEIDVPKELL